VQYEERKIDISATKQGIQTKDQQLGKKALNEG
jgi:hypothetical protein